MNDIVLDSFKEFNPTLTTYVVTTTYNINQVVTDSGTLYESLIDSNTDPLTTTTSWRQTTLLSLYHRMKIQRAIENVLGDIVRLDPLVDEVKLGGTSISDQLLVDNRSERVGFILRPRNTRYYKTRINNIGLQFDGSQAVTIELYKENTLVSSQAYNATQEFQWYDSSFELGDGKYYLFYNQTGLSQSAVNYHSIATAWNDAFTTDNFAIQPFSANPTQDLTTIASSNFRSWNNFGISLDISIETLLTDWIVRNMNSFAKAIQLQYAFDHINDILFNPNIRHNRTQRNAELNTAQLEFEIKSLEGDSIVRKLNAEKKRLTNSVENSGFVDRSLQVQPVLSWESNFSG